MQDCDEDRPRPDGFRSAAKSSMRSPAGEACIGLKTGLHKQRKRACEKISQALIRDGVEVR
jgi:hypothetical protein